MKIELSGACGHPEWAMEGKGRMLLAVVGITWRLAPHIRTIGGPFVIIPIGGWEM